MIGAEGTYRKIHFTDQLLRTAICEYIEEHHEPVIILDHEEATIEFPKAKGTYAAIVTILMPGKGGDDD